MEQHFERPIQGGQFAQIINNYYDVIDYWQEWTTEGLKHAIRQTKQKKRRAIIHKWLNPWSLISLPFGLAFLLKVFVPFYTWFSNPVSIFSQKTIWIGYTPLVLLVMALTCFHLSLKSGRRDSIFISRCNRVIDICEQIIHERKYD